MDVVAVVGLGYVGLPLAVAFGKIMPTIGYDLSMPKLDSYRQYTDPSGTVSEADLRAAQLLTFTGDHAALAQANILIVAVPTPIDVARRPDLGPLVRASESIGAHLKAGDLVIYESTVYPGATEEVCIPVLERVSGLQWRRDFHVGYSPERINPGDQHHT
ncbi:MAG: nucleotide sugar dehydrogenase, partial [Rhodoferax sp.]